MSINRAGNLVGLMFSVAAATALVACGGGGDAGAAAAAPTPASATAEGVYGGASSGSSSNAFELLVLEDGSYWSIYGTQTATTFLVNGFVQGTGTSNNSTFTSADARDFGFSPALAGTVNAPYNSSTKTIQGTVGSSLGSVTFNGGPLVGSTYDYNAAASLSTLAGAWSLTETGGETVAMSVSLNGQFTATGSSGCKFSGSVTPRASGKNVYTVSLTFGAAPCALAGQNATGIAVSYPITGGRTQLLIAVADGTRQFGAAAVGTR